MKNTFAILVTTTAIGLVAAAYAEDMTKSNIEYKANGGYESTQSTDKTTAAGTNETSEKKVVVDIDSSGKARKTVTTDATTNPKGMLNEKRDTTKTDFKEKARGGYLQTTTTKHTDADGTNVTMTTTTDVDVDSKGTVTTTAKTEKSVDPKGMLNEKKTSSSTKSVNGVVVEEQKKN